MTKNQNAVAVPEGCSERVKPKILCRWHVLLLEAAVLNDGGTGVAGREGRGKDDGR